MSWVGRPSAAANAFPNTRPKDAATLIVIRRDRDAIRLLMGRRSDAHVFMPGAVVFPGGGVDRDDRRAPALDELHPDVAAKLAVANRNPQPPRLRALGLAAIREACEETGILVGRRGPDAASNHPAWTAFREAGIGPTLEPLRLVARAITPPRMVRRFDARFFAVFADAIAAQVRVPDHELKSPAWLRFEEARAHPLPWITRAVLDALDRRLRDDPNLEPDGPVPFYSARRGRHIVDQL